jgi:Bacterial Ig-like domain (group 3)
MRLTRIKGYTLIAFLFLSTATMAAYPRASFTLPANKIDIDSKTEPDGLSQRVMLRFPSEADPNTARVYLNGRDVTSRFTGSQCNTGFCQSALLVETDGLRTTKNVLAATASKRDSPGAASGRLRFAARPNLNNSRAQTLRREADTTSPRAQANAPVGTLTGFLPPTVSFNTLSQGGWNGSAGSWIQIGTQTFPSTAPSGNCPILVMVFDGQTLEEKTSSPSPDCLSSGAALTTYLTSNTTTGDLVVVGTTFGNNADSALNTTAIGGTDYTKAPFSGNTNLVTYPKGYMAIGLAGAASGSAYENYSSGNGQTTNYYAFGMLTEDSLGNYSFQPSDPVEYIVSPNDPVYGASIVKTAIQPQFNNRYAGQNWLVYSPCASTGCANLNNQNGYYLLVLDRATLIPVTSGSNGSCSVVNTNPVAKNEVLYQNCGQFFPTGSSDFATATQAYQNLAIALNGVAAKGVTPGQLVFLTTVGTAAFADTANGQFQVAGTSNGAGNNAYAGQFAPALEALGGTPKTTLFLFQKNTAYTLVSSPGFGDSLSGDAVVSTNVDSAQGQTGYIHGTLERDNNGLYRPGDASQETPADAANNTGADYTIDKVTLQQPQDWPELNGTLSGGSTPAGMISAYQYISYQLISQYYIKGAQGAYLDDIHYYFTGGNNTYIDYHTFDPANLPYPGGACYTWTDPVSNQPLTCFTQQDFSAVANQVSAEVVDLVNVLQFMVNGSTNMKDIIAGGNANVALALTSAATTVYQSKLSPSTIQTPVVLNLHKIFNLTSKVVSLVTSITSSGILPPGIITGGGGGGGGGGGTGNGQPSILTRIKKTVTIVQNLSKAASAAKGSFYTGGQFPTPTSNYKFVATISQLANANLQGSMSIGFDTALDSILSDWGRLNAIGPQITDTSNPTFYSQDQVAQNAAISLLTQGSQRGFFLALMPVEFTVQYWPSVETQDPTNPVPDMASIHSHQVGVATCNQFYPYTVGQSSSWDQWAIAFPNYVGEEIPFQNNGIANPYGLDWFTIGSAATGSGSDTAQFPPPDPELQSVLFSSSQLNLPIDAFAATTNGNGPLPVMTYNDSNPAYNYLSSKQLDFPVGSIGSATGCQFNVGATAGTTSLTATTTSYSGPLTTVAGQTANLQATVVAASGTPVPTGSVTFTDSNATLGTATLDATGNATLPTSTLAVGQHSIVAYYVRQDPFDSSTSSPAMIVVSPNGGMQLTASANTLQVSYGTTSSAIKLQVTSLSGLTGAVSFACSGLPIGMNCQFSPSQVTLTDGGNATSSMTISSSAAETSGFGIWKGLGMLSLLIALLTASVVGRRARLVKVLCGVALVIIVGMIGCGGSGGSSKPPQETGTKTVLVSATSGTVTQSVPITVTIQ